MCVGVCCVCVCVCVDISEQFGWGVTENAGHFPASLPQCKHSLWINQALNETVNGADGNEGSAVNSRG